MPKDELRLLASYILFGYNLVAVTREIIASEYFIEKSKEKHHMLCDNIQ